MTRCPRRWRLVEPLASAHLQSIVLRARAIHRFSCLRHQPTRALTNQNAALRLRQSGNHAQAAKGECYSHSRLARLNTNDTCEFRSLGYIIPNTFFRIIYLPLAIVPF